MNSAWGVAGLELWFEKQCFCCLFQIPGLPNPFGGSKSTASSLHEITVNDIDGKSVNLGKYKGKVSHRTACEVRSRHFCSRLS